MKILLYSHAFAPAVGGMETSAALLAEGLASFRDPATGETFTVTVVTATPADDFDESKLPFKILRRPNIWKLLHSIREADLVHLAGPCFLPLVIAWLIGKPTVVVHHGYQSICPNGLLFKQPSQTNCVGHFMRRQYGQCLRCCAQTVGAKGGVRSLLLTFPRRWLCKRAATNIAVTRHVETRVQLPRSRTIYHGIAVADPVHLYSAVCASTTLEFGFIGRLVAEKGLPLYLLAGKDLADKGLKFRLNFIGDGPERANLEKMAHDLKLSEHVRFKGILSGTDLERAASCICALVMPSIWEETAGLAAIEQMMRGRLVIAADIGGLGELVGDAGLKFRPGDWHGLASCMQVGLENPAIVTSLGSVAHARALDLFRHDRMIERHVAVCREVTYH